MSKRLPRLFTEPLVQFLMIGACIYGAYAVFGAQEAGFRDARVHVDSNRINAFIAEWESRWKRPPTRDEIDGLIQSYVKEDILYRQAVAMGLDEDDPITRRRMAQKLEFLTSDLAMMVQPAEGELERYFNENEEAYRAPDRMTFSQVYFNPDIRGNKTLEDAAEVLLQLQAAGAPGEAAIQAGDGLMLQSRFVSVTRAETARQLGGAFAETLAGLEPGSWHGPVLSGYGVHLVYIHSFEKSPPPEFQSVKDAVLENWHLERREKFNADFFESLKNRYEVIIDEIPADRILEVSATKTFPADGESAALQ